MITASAPGKMFLLGEYAVLEGHGALVGAVDKRVVVQFTPGPGIILKVRGSLLGAELRSETLMDALEGDASRVAAGVLASGRFQAGELHVDSSALFEGERKLGFGSSAAVVVAVAAAMGGADFDSCRRWHNRAQGTQGSGGDIAASLHGSVAWLENGQVQRVETRPPLAILQHPQSASTPKLVGAAKAFAARAPDAYRAHMQTLGNLSRRGRDALVANDSAGFVSVVREANTALAAFGRDAEIEVATPWHLETVARVEALGGACKPAGAGGGDISLLTAANEETLNRIIEALKPHASRCVLARDGVTVLGS